jgi:hypothetical protein
MLVDISRVAAGLRPRLASLLLPFMVALAFAPDVAQADELNPGETTVAMPGLVRVTLPTPSPAPWVFAGGLGYGWMDDTQALEGGNRFMSSVAAAYSPTPMLSFGLDLRGHLDRYPDAPNGGETNLYGEPRINVRAGTAASSHLHLGVMADARLVGAEAPSIKLGATSPSFRALAALRLNDRIWSAAHVGVHVDRSAEAVPDPSLLSAPDRRTIGAGSSNAVQWGVGGSYRMGTLGTELLGELSGEVLLGTDQPSLARLTAGARHPLRRNLLLLVTAEFALSSRPLSLPADELAPIDPRATLMASVIWRFGQPPPAPRETAPDEATQPAQPPPTTAPAPEQPPPVQVSPVRGTVVDEGGRPLADVELTLTREGAAPVKVRSFADGSFEFPDVPTGDVVIEASTAGFDAGKVELGDEAERRTEIVLRPSVPAGQVRGKVLDLKGNPVAAKITITPGDHSLTVSADGSFELELPPGKYTVVFEHEDFRKQRRRIRVHDRGVVILNIALLR